MMPFMEEMVQANCNWDEMLQQAPLMLAREVILTRPDSISLKAGHNVFFTLHAEASGCSASPLQSH